MPPNHTCYLDSREDPPPMVCEGTPEGRKYWTGRRSELFSLGGGSPLGPGPAVSVSRPEGSGNCVVQFFFQLRKVFRV